MTTTVKIELNSTEQILQARNLETDGKAQRTFTNALFRLSSAYVPLQENILGTTVTLEADSITYKMPYARYQWGGVAMEGNPRTPTNRPLNYAGAPMRGKEWCIRCWADRKGDILGEVAKECGGKAE